MQPLYTAEQIRTHEGPAAQSAGLSLYDLMERAGAAVLKQIRQRYAQPTCLRVLCGAGNNGGDGYVIARLAQEQGWPVQVCAWCDPEQLSMGASKNVTSEALARQNSTKTRSLLTVSEHFSEDFNTARESAVVFGCSHEALRAADTFRQADGNVEPLSALQLNAGDLVVDALWGSGLDRSLPDDVIALIQRVHNSAVPVVSVDIPSGLQADTGAVMGAAFRADLTVSLVAWKQGLFTAQAADHVGTLILDDLGISAPFAQQTQPSARLNGQLVPFATARPRSAHKGHFGQIMVVGGHAGMAGAARMAGESCLHMGAGRVTVAVHPDSRLLTGAGCPELMVHGIAHPEVLSAALDNMTHLLVGPGLGQDEWSEQMWQEALYSRKPLLLDADGLNWLARHPKQPLPAEFIGTPHPGEAARLLQCSVADIERDRFAALNELCRVFGGVWVLKGTGTLIGNGQQCFVNTNGNPGMATAGMGDVLTGVIGGLWAQGLDALSAARCGVYGHGWAADQIVAEQGERGLLATDLYPALRRWVNM